MANEDEPSEAPTVLADHVVGVLALRVEEADPEAPVGVPVDGPYRGAAGREVFDESGQDEPLAYLHGHGNLLPPLEKALAGKAVGDSLSLTLGPEDAFGVAQDNARRVVPVDAFPEDAPLEPGLEFLIETDDETIPAWVEAVENGAVHVSLNHPLAGRALTFHVEVLAIREARSAELEHGHPEP